VTAVDHRAEIREFLTSRRAKIKPEQVDLPVFGGTRRVPGLRREEVALLAGVSVDWAHLHRAELEANWERSRREDQLEPVEPLPYIEPVEELLDVTAVEVVGKFRLLLTFEDGTVGDVDFGAREWRGVLEPLSDPNFFARVRVDPEADTIAWPNGG
jgi:hypothetical protein